MSNTTRNYAMRILRLHGLENVFHVDSNKGGHRRMYCLHTLGKVTNLSGYKDSKEFKAWMDGFNTALGLEGYRIGVTPSFAALLKTPKGAEV